MVSGYRRFSLAAHPTVRLPLSILIHYLFFLSRRPISRSNRHYLTERLRGLKALGQVLRDTGLTDLNQALQLLDKITPVNFGLLNEKLQYALLPLSPAIEELPPDLIVSNGPPPANVFERAHNILLICGPAIGIGDEIILFSLPTWIKQENPSVSITVLSAYNGLWDSVRNVDVVQQYSSYTDMLDVLRSRPPFDDFDTMILADFDRPGLYPAVAFETSPPCYVELSLGTEAVFVVDNAQRTLCHMPRLAPYFTNFYAGFAESARWLGLMPEDDGRFAVDGAGIVQRSGTRSTDQLRIYVSPFTSKYDPSPIYWSRLLCAVLADTPADMAIHCMLDTGPNMATRRFAQEIVRSVSARALGHIEFSVAEAADAEISGLRAALSWMADAHVVICADSFTAHAAPLFGCLTCVIAASGLDNWRVPHRASYYFGADGDMAQIAAAIRSLIRDHQLMEAGTTDRPVITDVERHLHHATQQLAVLFKQWRRRREIVNAHPEVDTEAILHLYQEFVKAYEELTEHLDAWPALLKALATDLDYRSLIQPAVPQASLADHSVDDLLRHLYDRWWQWEHSNVRKYLGLLCDIIPTPVDGPDGNVYTTVA